MLELRFIYKVLFEEINLLKKDLRTKQIKDEEVINRFKFIYRNYPSTSSKFLNLFLDYTITDEIFFNTKRKLRVGYDQCILGQCGGKLKRDKVYNSLLIAEKRLIDLKCKLSFMVKLFLV